MSETVTRTSNPVPTQTPVPLNTSIAACGVWLVKVPNYLAKKWNEAPNNSDVGVIRITQSKFMNKAKQEVVFHLNEPLSKSNNEKVPIEHKFIMTPLGNQDVFILKQSEQENIKDKLSIIGKVMQRAECTPIQNDTNYLQLKRETMKKFTEPKRQIKMASDFVQKTHFLPRSSHVQGVEKKDKTKHLRKEREQVMNILFDAFSKHQYYYIKDLINITKQPQSYLKEILHEICRYNLKGTHKNTWELKEEFKQGDLDSKKKAAIEKSVAKEEMGDDFMDDDDEDDLSSVDDDDEMIETI